MDYEKKYKDALERAKKWYYAPNADKIPTYANKIISEIFPELKEGEDERIRKAILELVKQSSTILNPMNQRSMIAWLEKQGEQPYWRPSEEQLQTLHAQLNEGAVTYPEDRRILFTLYEDLMKIMTQEEKQGEQNPVCSEEDKDAFEAPEGMHGINESKRACNNCKTFKTMHQNCPYSPIFQYKDLNEAVKHLDDETNCEFYIKA